MFATAFDQYAVKAFEVNAVDYLLKPFDKKRVAQAIQKARAKQDADGLPADKIETLVRMIESQKQPAAKVLLKAVGRMFLVDQKDICYAWIEDGVITVVTGGAAGMEGQSNCRTLEELLASSRHESFLAGAPVLSGEHQPHSRSRAMVQELLPVAHGRQEAD